MKYCVCKFRYWKGSAQYAESEFVAEVESDEDAIRQVASRNDIIEILDIQEIDEEEFKARKVLENCKLAEAKRQEAWQDILHKIYEERRQRDISNQEPAEIAMEPTAEKKEPLWVRMKRKWDEI